MAHEWKTPSVTLWLKQLRSDEAEKHVGFLENYYNNKKRCCLGHACHVLAPEIRDVKNMQVHYGKMCGLLPRNVAKLLNITLAGDFHETHLISDLQKVIPGLIHTSDQDRFDSLTEINDHTNITLSQMADLIEWAYEEKKLVEW